MSFGGIVNAGAGEILLRVRDQTRAGLRQVQRRLARVQQSFAAIGRGLTITGGTALAGFFAGPIRQASRFEEVLSKFQIVFAKNQNSVREWARTYSQEVGRSERQTLQFLAGFQDLLVPIGIDPQVAEETSKQLTKLTADLASFNNFADDNVVRDLQAALTGSSEVMKKYGVIVNETAVKQELLNQGIKKTDATEPQKALARYAIILRDTSTAQGDAVRTAGSYANQVKRLGAELENLQVSLGTPLLGVITPLLARVNEFGRSVTALAEANPQLAKTAFFVAAGATAMGVALLGVSAVLGGVGFAVVGLTSALAAIPLAATIAGGAIAGVAAAAAIAGVRDFEDLKAAAESLRQTLSRAFGTIAADAKVAFMGIRDSLSAGEIENAAKIASKTIELEFARAFLAVRGTQFGFESAAIKGFGEVSKAAGKLGVVILSLGEQFKLALGAVNSFAAEGLIGVQNFVDSVKVVQLKARLAIAAPDVRKVLEAELNDTLARISQRGKVSEKLGEQRDNAFGGFAQKLATDFQAVDDVIDKFSQDFTARRFEGVEGAAEDVSRLVGELSDLRQAAAEAAAAASEESGAKQAADEAKKAKDGARVATGDVSARGSFSLSSFARGGGGGEIQLRGAVDKVRDSVVAGNDLLASIDKSLKERQGLVVGA